jgi:hypothetical protein
MHAYEIGEAVALRQTGLVLFFLSRIFASSRSSVSSRTYISKGRGRRTFGLVYIREDSDIARTKHAVVLTTPSGSIVNVLMIALPSPIPGGRSAKRRQTSVPTEMSWITGCRPRGACRVERFLGLGPLGGQGRQLAGEKPAAAVVHRYAAAQVPLPSPPFGRAFADVHLHWDRDRRGGCLLPDPAFEPLARPQVGRPGTRTA